MKYLSVKVCQALHKLGVKCETGKVWPYHKTDSPWDRGNIESKCPAYSLPLLITDSEAMKIVFGDKLYQITDGVHAVVIASRPMYKIKAHQLLSLCLSGDYEAAEQLLVEALKRDV